MNKPYKEHIIVVCTSTAEREAFERYKAAKKDSRAWNFRFSISKDNDVKIAIEEIIK